MTDNRINKTELIEQLAEELGIPKAQAEKYLGAFIELITRNLVDGTQVNITGFGLFKVTQRRAHMGIDPKRLTPMMIPESFTPAFQAGNTLRTAVRAANKKD